MTVAFCLLVVAIVFNVAAGLRAWQYIRQLECEVFTLRGGLPQSSRRQGAD